MIPKVTSPSAILLLFVATAAAPAGDPCSVRESSVTGDLPIRKGGELDILLKPYNHNAPRIDILLNSSQLR